MWELFDHLQRLCQKLEEQVLGAAQQTMVHSPLVVDINDIININILIIFARNWRAIISMVWFHLWQISILMGMKIFG